MAYQEWRDRFGNWLIRLGFGFWPSEGTMRGFWQRRVSPETAARLVAHHS